MQSRSACSHSYCRSGERRHGILGCMDMATALPSFQSSSQFSRPSFGLPNPSRSPFACACLCQHHQLLIYTIWLVNRWGLVQDLTLAIIMLNYTWTIYICVCDCVVSTYNTLTLFYIVYVYRYTTWNQFNFNYNQSLCISCILNLRILFQPYLLFENIKKVLIFFFFYFTHLLISQLK